jgi:hypothetical protein
MKILYAKNDKHCDEAMLNVSVEIMHRNISQTTEYNNKLILSTKLLYCLGIRHFKLPVTTELASGF